MAIDYWLRIVIELKFSGEIETSQGQKSINKIFVLYFARIIVIYPTENLGLKPRPGRATF